MCLFSGDTHAMKARVILLVSAIEDAELPWPNCGMHYPLLGTDLLKNKLLVSALYNDVV